jgi:hypothetical protein
MVWSAFGGVPFASPTANLAIPLPSTPEGQLHKLRSFCPGKALAKPHFQRFVPHFEGLERSDTNTRDSPTGKLFPIAALKFGVSGSPSESQDLVLVPAFGHRASREGHQTDTAS